MRIQYYLKSSKIQILRVFEKVNEEVIKIFLLTSWLSFQPPCPDLVVDHDLGADSVPTAAPVGTALLGRVGMVSHWNRKMNGCVFDGITFTD